MRIAIGFGRPSQIRPEPKFSRRCFECVFEFIEKAVRPRRIRMINWIIMDIEIPVWSILVADWVGLQEPRHIGIIDPSLVVIELKLGQLNLAGVSKP